MPRIHIANIVLRFRSEPGESFFCLVETGAAEEEVEDGVADPDWVVIVVGTVKVCAATVVPATVRPDAVLSRTVVAFIVVPGTNVAPVIVVTTIPNALAGIALPTPELVH